jgi:hypothetical protein
VDYVLGWVRQARTALPVVTSGNAKDKVPGAFGQPGTSLVFGDSGIGFRTASGIRLTLGAWIDHGEVFGIVGSTFGTERRANDFTTTTDSTGKPLLALPFINNAAGKTQSAHVISVPGTTTGNILIASNLQRFGDELSAVWRCWHRPGLEFSVLAGLRYEDLEEGRRILQHSFVTANSTNTTFDDRFDTRNQFLGGQLAGRVHAQFDVWVFEFTSKIALGSTFQTVDVQGDSSQYGPKSAVVGSFPGGFFTQPSNLGRTNANTFTAIPSVAAKIGYQLTPHCRLFAGYEILYWNSVVRPEDQIDRNVNLSQSAILGTTHGTLVGPAAPAPLLRRSGFWAQDMRFGVELRF